MNKKTIYNLIVCEDKMKELAKVNSKLEFDKHLIISGYILDITSQIFYLHNLFHLNLNGVIASSLSITTGRTMQVLGLYNYQENTFKKMILQNKKD